MSEPKPNRTRTGRALMMKRSRPLSAEVAEAQPDHKGIIRKAIRRLLEVA